MALQLLTVVGARPQFIKAAALSRHIRDVRSGEVVEKIIHTGQHYDENMSDVFFKQLDIPHPTFRFEVNSATHGAMTGQMLRDIESVILAETPDCVLIYGDTNSTVAGALAAAKLHVPVAHVEAGLRSFNKRMPEELNRIVADQLSTLLYCPTESSCGNLRNEGIIIGVRNVGDIMYDVSLHYAGLAEINSFVMQRLELEPSAYVLTTIHRAENTDAAERIGAICRGIGLLAERTTVVFPVHPRTLKVIRSQGLDYALRKVRLIEPLPFLDMLMLLKNASAILTDSGGVQKEAFFYKKPCVTVRDETEWVETVEAGWNRLVIPDEESIVAAVSEARAPDGPQPAFYGTGRTAEAIVDDLLANLQCGMVQ